MVDWNKIDLNDYLVRRLKGEPNVRRVIDTAKYGKNFVMGEASPLRGPVRPNFTMGNASANVYHNVPTKNFPAVVKSNVPAKPIKVIPNTNASFKHGEEIEKLFAGANDKLKMFQDIAKGTARDTIQDFKSVATTGKPVNAAPKWAAALPILSNAWDINRGINQAFNGHPIMGAAQTAYGMVGLGAMGLATKPAKKIALDMAGKKALKNIKNLNNFMSSARGQAIGTVIPELDYWLVKGKKKTNPTTNEDEEKGKKLAEEFENGKGSTLPPQRKNIPNQYPSGPSGSVESFLTNYYGNNAPYGQEVEEQQLQGLPNVDGSQVGGGVNLNLIQGQQPQQGGMTMEQLLDWYTSRMGTDPEANNIKAYADKYKSLQRDAYNRDLFHAALAGLSDNPQYGRLIGRYNPAEMEATELDLRNKSLQTEQDRYDKLNELVGNATIAGQLGLPLEAALANKNLLNTYTNLGKAQYGLYGKMYGADTSANAKRDVATIMANAKITEAKLDNAMRYAISQNNIAAQKEIQKMKNENRVQVAQITGLPFAELDQYFSGMNALKLTNVDTSKFGGIDNLFE